MMTIDVSVIPAKESADDLWKGGADRYDYGRLPEEMRGQAMLAQGTVVEGLSSAVRRVIEAGQALSWAKAEMPHGEYLPWVQQACGLKPERAQKLVKAAEWANAAHERHLDGVTDLNTLFLLSANTTPEEVREWFMERCAAGEVPSRADVQERKRTAGRTRQPQPAEAMALSILRKGELDRIRQALQLAERASTVSAADVMNEQRLRDLGKLRHIPGAEADFHRMKDGSWIRLPHAGNVDIPAVEVPAQEPEPATPTVMESGLMTWDLAAAKLGMAATSLKVRLSPMQLDSKGPYQRNGYWVRKEGRGMVRLTPVAP